MIRGLNRLKTEPADRNPLHLFSIASLIFVFVTLPANEVAFAAGEPRMQAAGEPALDKPAELSAGHSRHDVLSNSLSPERCTGYRATI